MEDQIKAVFVKRQALGHVGADDGNVITLARRDQSFGLQLPLRIIQHRALRAKCSKNRHLLPAAGSQSQHALSLQVAEPIMRNEFDRRQLDVPRTGLCLFIFLVGNRLPPFPALLDPAVDGFAVDLLIRNVHKNLFYYASFASFHAT